MPYYITCLDDVQRLLTDKSIQYRYDEIELSFNNLSSKHLEPYTKPLNKYYFSCGCDTGAIASIITLGTGIIYFSYFSSWTWLNMGFLIMTTFLSGLIGKLLALAYAKYATKKHLIKISNLIQTNL